MRHHHGGHHIHRRRHRIHCAPSNHSGHRIRGGPPQMHRTNLPYSPTATVQNGNINDAPACGISKVLLAVGLFLITAGIILLICGIVFLQQDRGDFNNRKTFNAGIPLMGFGGFVLFTGISLTAFSCCALRRPTYNLESTQHEMSSAPTDQPVTYPQFDTSLPVPTDQPVTYPQFDASRPACLPSAPPPPYFESVQFNQASESSSTQEAYSGYGFNSNPNPEN